MPKVACPLLPPATAPIVPPRTTTSASAPCAYSAAPIFCVPSVTFTLNVPPIISIFPLSVSPTYWTNTPIYGTSIAVFPPRIYTFPPDWVSGEPLPIFPPLMPIAEERAALDTVTSASPPIETLPLRAYRPYTLKFSARTSPPVISISPYGEYTPAI